MEAEVGRVSAKSVRRQVARARQTLLVLAERAKGVDGEAGIAQALGAAKLGEVDDAGDADDFGVQSLEEAVGGEEGATGSDKVVH